MARLLHTQEVTGSSPVAPTKDLKTRYFGNRPDPNRPALDLLPQQFIKERIYLHGVSKKTVAWYRDSFYAFLGALETEEQIKQRIVELMDRGVKPVSVNTYLRCVRAYWQWQGKEWKIPKLKEEQKILATLSESDISRLIKGSIAGRNLHRAHLIALTILDTGLRASEVLGLTVEAVDFDNLTIKVMGKGGKQRLIPFSVELRKRLWRHRIVGKPIGIFFGTKNNTKVSVRNLERDLKILGKQLGITGIRFSPHTLRHTFACQYLMNGGDLFALSRILGHSKVTTTQIYLRAIGIEHLQANHRQYSPLSRLR